MDKKQTAFNALESAFFVAVAACFPDSEDETFFNELPKNVQDELMKMQKNVCADLNVTPQDISAIGDEETFIYSSEPFLSQS
jgi:hypothetical protein